MQQEKGQFQGREAPELATLRFAHATHSPCSHTCSVGRGLARCPIPDDPHIARLGNIAGSPHTPMSYLGHLQYIHMMIYEGAKDLRVCYACTSLFSFHRHISLLLCPPLSFPLSLSLPLPLPIPCASCIPTPSPF